MDKALGKKGKMLVSEINFKWVRAGRDREATSVPVLSVFCGCTVRGILLLKIFFVYVYSVWFIV